MRRDEKFLPQACGVVDMNSVALSNHMSVPQNKSPDWPQSLLCRVVQAEASMTGKAELEGGEGYEAGVRAGHGQR